uniref:Bug family tripartite tricarboxylate transporter substrate binding protein n=1 Tax=Bordetella sputigena TaxID=1416810 RepID=UPI0039EFED96
MSQSATAAASSLCPAGSIQLIVPWPAGGGTDLQARIIAEPLGQRLGKQIVVVNRPGAGGVVGTNSFVNNARPDGCTLLLATGAANTAAPYLFKDLHYDPVTDFTPVAFIAAAPNVLYVGSKSDYKTAQQFIAAAKAQPGKYTYGSGGIGASSHLAGALFTRLAGLNLVHVPYQGAAPALAALLGGQVDISVDTAAQIAQVRSGALRALAVASKRRLEALPDVPTFDEVGVKGLYYAFWGGVAGPKGMPAAMVEELNQAVNDVVREPKVRDYFVANGGEVNPMTPAAFMSFWQEELKRNKDIVAFAGAKAN